MDLSPEVRTRVARWRLMVGVALLVTACEPASTLQVAGDDDAPRWSVAESLEDAVDEHGSAPVVESGTPFVTLALRWDAPEPATLSARARDDQGAWTEWRPVEVTWSEAGLHVGRAELSGLAYQIRVEPAEHADRVAGLEVEAVLEVPAGSDELPPDPTEADELAPDLGDIVTVDDDAEPEDPSASTELKSGGRKPRVISRSAWGARGPRCSYGSHRPNRITIHHTVTPTNDSMSAAARVRQIQAFHQNGRGWCDIGYHFLVARDGRIFQGRPHTRLGAHVANSNSGNVGISFLGSFDSGRPSDAQLCSAAQLVSWLSRSYGIPKDRAHVKGHRQYGGTSCPGGNLYSKLGNIVSMSRSGRCSSAGGSAGGNAPNGGQARPPAQEEAPDHGMLKGIIYANGDTGRRLAGATVRLSDGRTTRTDSRGVYRFNVRPGRYHVRASKRGWQTASTDPESVRAGTTRWASVGLRPAPREQPTGKLVGVVYRHPSSERRLAGAEVRLSTGQRVRTNEHGVYRADVRAGEVRVVAAKAGYREGSVTRTVPRGGEIWGSVGLRPR